MSFAVHLVIGLGCFLIGYGLGEAADAWRARRWRRKRDERLLGEAAYRREQQRNEAIAKKLGHGEVPDKVKASLARVHGRKLTPADFEIEDYGWFEVIGAKKKK